MTSRMLKKEYENGKVYLTGPMLLADTPNANGIVYPKHVLEKMVNEYNARTQPLYGTTEVERSYKVNLNDVVAQTEYLELKEDHIEARVEVLPTIHGKELEKAILENETMNVGFNTLVMGSLVAETNIVNDDAILLGFSVVPLETLE